MINAASFRERYLGNGVSTSFEYGFPIIDKTHISVTRVDASGVEFPLAVDTDYSVGGVDNPDETTWLISYPVSGDPLATGEHLVIVPNLPLVQTRDLENQGGFYADRIEASFDYITVVAQQLQEQINRCLKVSVGSDFDELGVSLGSDGLLAVSGGSLTVTSSPAVLQSSVVYVALGTGTDTYAATFSPAPIAYITSDIYIVRFINSNLTNAPTLNINSLGAKTLRLPNGNTIAANRIVVGGTYHIQYNGVDLIIFGIAQYGTPEVIDKAAAYALTSADSGRLFTNRGAAAKVAFTFTSYSADHEQTFYCADSDGLRVTMPTGHTVRFRGLVSKVSGYIETTSIGVIMKLSRVGNTEWVAHAELAPADTVIVETS